MSLKIVMKKVRHVRDGNNIRSLNLFGGFVGQHSFGLFFWQQRFIHWEQECAWMRFIVSLHGLEVLQNCFLASLGKPLDCPHYSTIAKSGARFDVDALFYTVAAIESNRSTFLFSVSFVQNCLGIFVSRASASTKGNRVLESTRRCFDFPSIRLGLFLFIYTNMLSLDMDTRKPVSWFREITLVLIAIIRGHIFHCSRGRT